MHLVCLFCYCCCQYAMIANHFIGFDDSLCILVLAVPVLAVLGNET